MRVSPLSQVLVFEVLDNICAEARHDSICRFPEYLAPPRREPITEYQPVRRLTGLSHEQVRVHSTYQLIPLATHDPDGDRGALQEDCAHHRHGSRSTLVSSQIPSPITPRRRVDLHCRNDHDLNGASEPDTREPSADKRERRGRCDALLWPSQVAPARLFLLGS